MSSDFTVDCANKLFLESGQVSTEGILIQIKTSDPKCSAQEIKDFLISTELWKNDTTCFTIPEIQFEEVSGCARASSLLDFLDETAEKLEEVAVMFQGMQARNLLHSVQTMRDIQSGLCSDCTLTFRDPSGRLSLSTAPSCAAQSSTLVTVTHFARSWSENLELDLLSPQSDQKQGPSALSSLADALFSSSGVCFFTGAGISTESGIPCYRGAKPEGIEYENTWDVYDPSDEWIENFSTKNDARRRYWRRWLDLQPQFQRAKPNAAHTLPKYLADTGRLSLVITTNIDQMYAQAQVPEERMLYLHGTSEFSRCLAHCPASSIMPTSIILENLESVDCDPSCQHCGAPIKPLTISFGQPLVIPIETGLLADSLHASDLTIVMGSSLTVAPSNKIPVMSLNAKIPLCIINYDQTSFDPFASYLFAGTKCGQVCEQLIHRLTLLDNPSAAHFSSGLVSLNDLDLHFSRYSYVEPHSYSPSGQDWELFELLNHDQILDEKLWHLNRWFSHLIRLKTTE